MSAVLTLCLVLLPGTTLGSPVSGLPSTDARRPLAGEATDTVFDVSRGERLAVKNFGGRILVGSWDEDEVEQTPAQRVWERVRPGELLATTFRRKLKDGDAVEIEVKKSPRVVMRAQVDKAFPRAEARS